VLNWSGVDVEILSFAHIIIRFQWGSGKILYEF
jgi:hypothetical protein